MRGNFVLIQLVFIQFSLQTTAELLNNGIQTEVKERIQVLIEKKDSLFSS